MRLMTRLRHRLRLLIQPESRERDLDDELAFHLHQQTALYEEAGMSREEARAAAQRAFGSPTVMSEACRDARGWRLWSDASRDLRFGWRAAVRGRGTMAAAVVTLGLGIGAATAMFSVVDAVLLRPLPFPDADRLIRADQFVAPGALRVLREHQRAFAELALIQPDVEVNFGASATPERVTAIVASDGALEMLGVDPTIGRRFTPEDMEAGSSRVAILGGGLWMRRFGASRDVIGQVVQIDGVAREIVGILPSGALPPLPAADLWLPATTSGVAPADLWGSSYLALFGRLRTGVSAAEATADLRRLAPIVRDSYPWRMPDVFGAEIAAVPLLESLIGDVRVRLWLLGAAVLLLLCAACANVATLVLSRALLREREFALRAALGASRRRLMQQLLTESLVLWLVGGATGLLVAHLGLDVLRAWLPADVPRLTDLSIAWRAVAMCLAATLVTGLVFGLLPAWRMSRPVLVPFLKANDGGVATTAGRQVVVKTLVVIQLSLAVVLVSGSVLLSRSVWNLSQVAPGLDPDDVLAATITPDRLACAAPSQCEVFYDRVVERMRALPQVTAVGLGGQTPIGGPSPWFALDVQDHPVAPGAPAYTALRVVATPGYFEAIDLPVSRGRGLNERDRTSPLPVVVVNDAFARRFWPGVDPVGKQIRYVWQPTWRTVVGVVRDVRQAGPAAPAPLAFYIPYGQEQPRDLTLLVESSLPAPMLAREVRLAVSAANPNVPVSDIRPLRRIVDESLAGSASLLWLLSAFGVVVLVLGAVGTYGVLASTVSARQREIGIRLALGATPRSVGRLVWRDAGRLCGWALVIGVPLSAAAASRADHLLFGTGTRDVGAQLAVLAVMTLSAIAAAAVPAWRAARVDPLRALRDA
jgi:predicted permease